MVFISLLKTGVRSRDLLDKQATFLRHPTHRRELISGEEVTQD
jgi:hypothetical protein